MTIPRINIEALRGSGVYVFDVTDELVRWGQAFNAWADTMEEGGPIEPDPVTADTIRSADNRVSPPVVRDEDLPF